MRRSRSVKSSNPCLRKTSTATFKLIYGGRGAGVRGKGQGGRGRGDGAGGMGHGSEGSGAGGSRNGAVSVPMYLT